MSNRRIAGISLGLAVAAFLATALALVAAGLGVDLGGGFEGLQRGPEPREPREVRLVARDMAYYLPGGTTPNPTLRFAPGERVRVVLVNEDPGMAHDVVSSGLDLRTPIVQGSRSRRGAETASDVVRMPERPGTHEYVCSLHPVLMRGRIEIR